jgi:hypothetical protein
LAFATLPFLNLPISEVQETSDWHAHGRNVMSEQRESNRQHPNAYYREREKTPGDDKCDTSQNPHPYRPLPAKAIQIIADPTRDVILEAVHFFLEIRSPRHARLSRMVSVRSFIVMPLGRQICEDLITQSTRRTFPTQSILNFFAFQFGCCPLQWDYVAIMSHFYHDAYFLSGGKIS